MEMNQENHRLYEKKRMKTLGYLEGTDPEQFWTETLKILQNITFLKKQTQTLGCIRHDRNL